MRLAALRARGSLGILVSAALLSAAAVAAQDRTPRRGVPPVEERTQFVLMSMDTTPSATRPVEHIGLYQFQRALNASVPESARPVGFTLFISTGGLQLDPRRRRVTEEERPYLGREPRNRPVMHYAEDVEEIRNCALNVRDLAAAGVEIGSHGVRHDHGREWDEARWRFELEDHNRVLDLVGLPHPRGFRAPFLEWNAHLYRVMDRAGQRYDASHAGGTRWPTQAEGTRVWQFGIPSVHVEGVARPVLFFDDNMDRVLRRLARERGLTGGAELRRFLMDRFYEAGRSRFYANYRRNRAPFLISGHGGFRPAIRRIMREVCRLPNVRCATFSEAVAYLDAHPELAGR